MFPDFSAFRMQHRPDVSAPIGVGLSSSACFVDWYGRGARDVLVSGHPWYFSGGVYLCLQDLQKSGPDKPVYFPPTRLHGINGHFVFPAPQPDGSFDLLSYSPRNPGPRSRQSGRSIGWIHRHRNAGNRDCPVFHALPDDVPCQNGSLEKQLAGARLMSITPEYDTEGRLCAVIVSINTDPDAYWPDRRQPWQQDNAMNAPFDSRGDWRGQAAKMQVLRFPFDKNRDRPLFGSPKIIAESTSLFTVDAALRQDSSGEKTLIMRSDTDFLSIGEPAAPPEAAPLRIRLRDHFFNTQIFSPPKPLRGTADLLISGNTGYISYLGNSNETVQETRLEAFGTAMRVGTLAVPSAVLHDGGVRVYVGDATGHIHCATGTRQTGLGPSQCVRDPVGEICHQAGPNGSIQGPNERRWGYVNPLATAWTQAHAPDLIVNDITGSCVLYPSTGDPDGLLFGAARALTLDGAPLCLTWRSRPARWSSTELLVHMEDGLRLVERSGEDPYALHSGRRVRFSDGSPVAAGMQGGLAGRSVLQRVDCPGSQHSSVLAAIDHRSAAAFGAPQLAGSAIVLLKVAEDAEDLVLHPAILLKTRTGSPLILGSHNPGVSYCAQGWDDDEGTLIAGAEDGHLYAFPASEFPDLTDPN
ncbi:hypothetical protein [Salipiger pentaromativorans]|uniref:hypothetical protein n=1 Tax=Salipiger pentaromativorans TaxID=2943193 RepID=UPI00215747DC|nr:hypothetical protein [Salipiger pentaromativorans]